MVCLNRNISQESENHNYSMWLFGQYLIFNTNFVGLYIGQCMNKTGDKA